MQIAVRMVCTVKGCAVGVGVLAAGWIGEDTAHGACHGASKFVGTFLSRSRGASVRVVAARWRCRTTSSRCTCTPSKMPCRVAPCATMARRQNIISATARVPLPSALDGRRTGWFYLQAATLPTHAMTTPRVLRVSLILPTKCRPPNSTRL